MIAALLLDTFAMRIGDAEHSRIDNSGQRTLREVTTLGDRFLMLATRDAELVVLDEHLRELRARHRPGARRRRTRHRVPRAFLRTASAKSRSVRR